MSETRLLHSTPDDIAVAGRLLRAGELVAIPTETVYGLAANALDGQAAAHIFAAKGRPQDNPLIVHIAHACEWAALVRRIPPVAEKLARAFWPGPLTMILPKADCVPPEVSGGLDTVAVRLPAHPVARAVIEAAGVPLAAPSANLSGRPSPTTAAHVLADMQGRIAAIVDGGSCEVGVESTVIDLCGEVPRVLRPGGITLAMLRGAAGAVSEDEAVLHGLAAGASPRSPGMKYKHYAPRAQVCLVRGSAAAFAAFVNAHAGAGVVAMGFTGEDAGLTVPFIPYGARHDCAAQAQHVFDALRRIDEENAVQAYVACPDTEELGRAVYNRLLRAAGFEVVDLAE